MKKLKVLTVVGTRPEIIRLACVLNALDANDAIDHTLVHTGQNYDYELNEIFFEDLGIRKPDHFLNAAGKNATETIGKILIAIDPLLERIAPDHFWYLATQTLAFVPFLPKKEKFRFSIWKRATVVSISEYLRKPIVKSLIT